MDEDGEIVAVVEHKTLADLTGSLVDGSLTFVLAERDAGGQDRQ